MMIIDEEYTPEPEEKKTERVVVVPDFTQDEMNVLREKIYGNIVLPDFGDLEMRLLAELLTREPPPPPRPEFTRTEIAEMLPPSLGPQNRKERRTWAAQNRHRR